MPYSCKTHLIWGKYHEDTVSCGSLYSYFSPGFQKLRSVSSEECGKDRVSLEGQDLFGNTVGFNSELEVILDVPVVTQSIPNQYSFTRTAFCSFINPFPSSPAVKESHKPAKPTIQTKDPFFQSFPVCVDACIRNTRLNKSLMCQRGDVAFLVLPSHITEMLSPESSQLMTNMLFPMKNCLC